MQLNKKHVFLNLKNKFEKKTKWRIRNNYDSLDNCDGIIPEPLLKPSLGKYQGPQFPSKRYLAYASPRFTGGQTTYSFSFYLTQVLEKFLHGLPPQVRELHLWLKKRNLVNDRSQQKKKKTFCYGLVLVEEMRSLLNPMSSDFLEFKFPITWGSWH